MPRLSELHCVFKHRRSERFKCPLQSETLVLQAELHKKCCMLYDSAVLWVALDFKCDYVSNCSLSWEFKLIPLKSASQPHCLTVSTLGYWILISGTSAWETEKWQEWVRSQSNVPSLTWPPRVTFQPDVFFRTESFQGISPRSSGGKTSLWCHQDDGALENKRNEFLDTHLG